MLGAILGDIVGSPYEFDHNNYKHREIHGCTGRGNLNGIRFF